MISNDEIGQTPVKFDNVIENSFKVVCGMNINKGKKFLLETYDPTQLQLIRGCLFLVYLVLFRVAKSFVSKILSAHKMTIFSGFNRLLEKVIKNLMIINS